LGGVIWDYVQYAVGLARMGHDVFYIEDTSQWPYDPSVDGLTDDPSFNVGVLSSVMRRFGLAERWAYRFPRTGAWYGMSDLRRTEAVASADLLINVSGMLGRPEQYQGAARLVYVDTDPVFTQVKIARGQQDLRRAVGQHDVHFSFGERISEFQPATGHAWKPTRQPVLLDEWSNSEQPPRPVFTTVMNWTSYNAVEFEGVTYGQKDEEFRRFIDLPSRIAPQPLELAINAGRTRRTPHDLLAHKGWHVVSPADVCAGLDAYRSYIQSSRGEWSVAKNAYVAGRSGWFSCRSACYLAAGRPVIVQDTAFSPPLPRGVGILAFSTLDDAVAALNDVSANYAKHARAAREIAEAYFDANRVLTGFIAHAMAPSRAAAEVAS
jgi:hypothetical protein